MKGGAQVNVIPDRAIAEFDMRTLPGQNHDDILASIRTVARETEAEYEGGQIVVETINSLPALETAVDSGIVRAALETRSELGLTERVAGGASYFTDGSVLQTPGSDILILGPGDPGEAHQTDESLDIPDFLTARQIYTGIACRFYAPLITGAISRRCMACRR
ncbi:M20 family metallopeptidase [Ochrobactrum tritici]|uniref:M20 family metallopeptidase n=1 Tax=Brucella tritici TaxID=94626 RepID=A0A7X6FRI7_9HYPH|nr:M20 family metallopeptidase [Brucella tritici]